MNDSEHILDLPGGIKTPVKARTFKAKLQNERKIFRASFSLISSYWSVGDAWDTGEPPLSLPDGVKQTCAILPGDSAAATAGSALDRKQDRGREGTHRANIMQK